MNAEPSSVRLLKTDHQISWRIKEPDVRNLPLPPCSPPCRCPDNPHFPCCNPEVKEEGCVCVRKTEIVGYAVCVMCVYVVCVACVCVVCVCV